MVDHIANVTVLGTGVLGSQIAFQTAFHGFDVTAYDIDDAALAGARQRFAGLATTYTRELAGEWRVKPMKRFRVSDSRRTWPTPSSTRTWSSRQYRRFCP